jgi:hypothetical protein
VLLFAPETCAVRWVIKSAAFRAFPEGFCVMSGRVANYPGSVGIVHSIALWCGKNRFTILVITFPIIEKLPKVDLACSTFRAPVCKDLSLPHKYK